MHNSSSDFVFQGQTASILSYSISQFPDKKEVSAQMACFHAQASRYFVDLLKNDFDSLGRLPKWWRCIPTEIDAINGAIVEQARRYNVSVSYNSLIVDLIHAIEGAYKYRNG